MRPHPVLARAAFAAALAAAPLFAQGQKPAEPNPDAVMLRKLYDAALVDSPAYEQLRELTEKFPGRLSGSKPLEGAVQWTRALLEQQGADRTELQPVLVPHWERGPKESVTLLPPAGLKGEAVALTAVALGGSVPTPADGLRAGVVELRSLDELKTADVRGKIVFFNRPMKQHHASAGPAYGEAGDARNRGPAEAAKHGAVGVVIHSVTHAHDDVPHTGNTTYQPDVPRIPAAALSAVAAARLSVALAREPALQLELRIHSQWFEDAPSHNVIAELRGSEHPEQVILIGGHLDSWDIAPGAHDDGAGVIESIDVLRIFRAVGYRPKHTIRCVLFTNEENGIRGAVAYSTAVRERKEQHLLALETDSGGYQAHGFNLGNPAGDAHLKAARWLELFRPYGIYFFVAGRGGVDVNPLLVQGTTVAGLMPDSQRYFDIHHTAEDSIDKVNPRELRLSAGAMAALVYLVDQHGL